MVSPSAVGVPCLPRHRGSLPGPARAAWAQHGARFRVTAFLFAFQPLVLGLKFESSATAENINENVSHNQGLY